MTNTDTNTKRKSKASERLLFDANGVETSFESAVRAVYKIPENGRSIEYVFGQNAVADRAFANFGFQTKIGNVANTVRNDKTNPGTPDDEADACDEFFAALVNNGQWREPGEARGPKYDDDILADVIFAYLSSKGIAKGDRDHYRRRLDDKSDRAKFLGAIGVKELYHQEAERRGVAKPAAPRALDDLA